MILGDAIKEYQETLQREAMSPVHLSRRAAKLGIEALERIQEQRIICLPLSQLGGLLPSEEEK